jgi:hypothetical protein
MHRLEAAVDSRVPAVRHPGGTRSSAGSRCSTNPSPRRARTLVPIAFSPTSRARSHGCAIGCCELVFKYQQLRDRVTALRREVEERDTSLDVADVRERLGLVLHGLRHQRARESDLIYEAFKAELDRDHG